MTQIAPVAVLEAQPERGASLVSSSDVALRLPALVRAGWLPVDLPIPGPTGRGHLASILEDGIESALAEQGCAPAGLAASQDLDSTLSDQLYRARTSGLGGMCVIVPPLHGMTSAAGVLDADDSAALRWWLEAASVRPLAIWLDDANRHLGVYGPPLPLHRLLSHDDRGFDDAHARPHHGSLRCVEREVEHAATEPTPCSNGALEGTPLDPQGERAFPPQADETPEPRRSTEQANGGDDQAATALGPEPSHNTNTGHLAAPDLVVDHGAQLAEVTRNADPVAGIGPRQSARSDPGHRDRRHDDDELILPMRAGGDRDRQRAEPPPMFPEAAEQWPRWVRELEAARGPKPLSVVERLFTSAYCPLKEAALRGIAPDAAADVAHRWAVSFEQSYAEAFDTLRLRGKRPTMVLDVPDFALRAGRLHGARAVQLILVDAMRFDLGLRVHQYLERALGDGAMLSERILTWSALPSTTSVQLELIGRGSNGLRDRTAGLDSDVSVARGRAAQTLRRIKAGSRELLKLDVVESNLCERGPAALERLDSIASAVAERLANYLLQLPPRTLAMVFGDHGFVIDNDAHGTTAGRHGGASPEEVLVPAFAWLTGAMH